MDSTAAREQRLRQLESAGRLITGRFGWGGTLLALLVVLTALWSGVGHRDARTRSAAVEQRSTSSGRISATFGKLEPGIDSRELRPVSAP